MNQFRNFALALLASFSLLSCGGGDDPTPSTGLIDGEKATFLFNGNLADGQGTFANAIVNGATLTTDRKGDANSAYLFDGVDDYISFGDNELYKGNTAFSVSIWAKPESHSGIIFNKEGEYEVALDFIECKGICDFTGPFFKWALSTGNTNWQWENSTTAFTENSWNHFVFTFNKGTIKTYLNGQLKEERTRTDQTVTDSALSFHELRIGGRQSGSQFFKGGLDDFRFYDFAITAANVSTLYADK